MSEYVYVKASSETWHLTLNRRITLCGSERIGRGKGGFGCWTEESKRPRGPLCKRCIKCREARG